MEHRKTYRERDGIRRTLCWDDADPGVFHIKTEQDVEPILESVARDREIMKQDGVFLRCDETVPFGIFASVIDTLRQSGINNISIVTEPLTDRNRTQ